jgi:signal peptide peptidase SppA
MAERLAHVTNFVLTHPWAIERPYLDLIATVLARHISGRSPDPETLRAAATKREQLPQPRRGGGVAIVPIHGIIAPRADLMTEMSGMTSLEALSALMNDVVADSAIRTIVLDIDTPGGSFQGCPEFAAKMRAWRQQKPIIAAVNYTAASAGFYIAANATEIVAPPSAQVGSIGVFTIHDSLVKALEMEGIERTYIFAGKHKVEGHEAAPLSKEDRQAIQSMVDQAYGFFTSDVAKGRNVSVSDVRSGYGEGRLLFAEDAKALGMVDRVETLDETISRLTPSSVSLAAEAVAQELQASNAAWHNEAYRALQELSL